MRIRRFAPLLTSLLTSVILMEETDAAIITFNYNVNQAIPDGSALGLSDTRTVITAYDQIQSVKVSIQVTGGMAGDYYVQLIGGSKNSVLMNRVGRTSTNSLGYSDSGFNVQFSDDAASGDVHTYRTTLFGNETTPLAGELGGVWAPDGRTTDPDAVLAADPRTSLLSNFTGMDPNGQWSLFLADMEGGDVGTLVSWQLEFDVVPEPRAAVLCLLATGIWLFRRPR
ncbi:PEP-CTERM sorting domain-containing protein [Luteolibacter yonseiensis]|uniref:PEP-CTERM sorting domain-containing protein n=1 Tax=Luteolibacter yonseiensis TaxID=1144680 RepID=A0A934R6Q0_9BACT|nr:proprotein convertase P-domain-containing protein [Luteolibacter yonseiensis]MBK1818007.1 PEP-CTERM sorting domain-containing protein [Luteolibacter yonseiensis]